MFVQGKFPHCGEWHPFTTQKKQHRNITTAMAHNTPTPVDSRARHYPDRRDLPSTVSLRNQKSRHAAENESPGLAGDPSLWRVVMVLISAQYGTLMAYNRLKGAGKCRTPRRFLLPCGIWHGERQDADNADGNGNPYCHGRKRPQRLCVRSAMTPIPGRRWHQTRAVQ